MLKDKNGLAYLHEPTTLKTLFYTNCLRLIVMPAGYRINEWPGSSGLFNPQVCVLHSLESQSKRSFKRWWCGSSPANEKSCGNVSCLNVKKDSDFCLLHIHLYGCFIVKQQIWIKCLSDKSKGKYVFPTLFTVIKSSGPWNPETNYSYAESLLASSCHLLIILGKCFYFRF